jgi:hypothetical protein
MEKIFFSNFFYLLSRLINPLENDSAKKVGVRRCPDELGMSEGSKAFWV